MEGGILSMCLGKECLELEEMCGVHCVQGILAGEKMWGKEMKGMLREVDRGHHIRRCREKAPLIVMVEEVVGWQRLWGDLLDYNNKRTKGL
jgi:hypothetical protein